MPQRDLVFSGDEIVTRDPYTGALGPQIVAGAATKDTGIAEAVRLVRAAGAT